MKRISFKFTFTPLLLISLWVPLSHSFASETDEEHSIVFQGVGKGVVLFIDFNASEMERNAAKQAAQELGSGFAMIPSLETATELSPIARKYKDAQDRLNSLSQKCDENEKICDSKAMVVAQENSDSAEDEAVDFAKQHPLNVEKELTALSEKLKLNQNYVSHLVISGHHESSSDSSSSFMGEFLSTQHVKDRALISILNQYPEVYQHLIFLGIWGCVGITHHQVKIFEKALPSIQVWAGFYGVAPSGIRPESSSYLHDVMVKIFEIWEANDPAELKASINKISAIHEVYSGIAVRLAHQQPWIYYQKKNLNGTNETHFEPLEGGPRCKKFLDEQYQVDIQKLNTYLDGSKNLPIDNESSDLRRIYYDLSQNYDCYENTHPSITPGKAGILRFYQKYVTNVVQAFSINFQQAITELALHPEVSFSLMQYQKIDLSNLEKVQRKDLISWIANLKIFLETHPHQFAKLKAIQFIMERYLIEIDMSCIDFLEWHDDSHYESPTPKCILKQNGEVFHWEVL